MVSMFTIAWDIIEILALVSTAVKALAVCGVAGFIGSIVIIAVSAAVIVYSIQSAINLYHQMERYRAGDEAAGEEILQDVWLNMVLSIVTIGGTQVTKALINRAVKEKLLKELGEEVLEGAVKKGDNLVKLLSSTHKLKKAGLGAETVADLAKTLSVESLDKLAKLAKKGMPVELLEAISRNTTLLDDLDLKSLLVLKEYAAQAGDLVKILDNHTQSFVKIYKKYGKTAIEKCLKYQDELFELGATYGDDCIDLIMRYDDEVVEGIRKYKDYFMNRYRDEGDAFVEEYLEKKGEVFESGTSKLAQYGDDFGKMGTYVENPNIKVDWTQYAEHAAERMKQRGMTQEMVNNIVENGKVLSQNNGNKFAYITQEGVAIVSKEGKLITAWSSTDFDSSMLEIINKLFGE